MTIQNTLQGLLHPCPLLSVMKLLQATTTLEAAVAKPELLGRKDLYRPVVKAPFYRALGWLKAVSCSFLGRSDELRDPEGVAHDVLEWFISVVRLLCTSIERGNTDRIIAPCRICWPEETSGSGQTSRGGLGILWH